MELKRKKKKVSRHTTSRQRVHATLTLFQFKMVDTESIQSQKEKKVPNSEKLYIEIIKHHMPEETEQFAWV